MKRPAKKKVSKAKAEKHRFPRFRLAVKAVESIKKQIATQKKNYATIVSRVEKAKGASRGFKPTAAAKNGLVAARKQASESRKQASALRDGVCRSAKVELKNAQNKT